MANDNSNICGVICFCGVGGVALACGFPPHSEGPHSWATLPTFGKDDPATELAAIRVAIKKHQKIQHLSSGITPADEVEGIIREYQDKAVRVLRDTKQFRDDMLAYFRALVIVLEMTGNAQTHKEKAARLRGAIELLEQMIGKLRRADLEAVFSYWRWPDIFNSDWPTERLMDKIRSLESELAELKGPQAAMQSDNDSGAELSW